jgi:hypothetical protein
MTDPAMRAFRARAGRGHMMGLVLALVVAALVPSSAWADKIKHPIAIFSGLDKITGRIISFEVATDETVQFGSLQITVRACYTRPATETPQTTTFIEVDEVDAANEYKRIFSGWMFAASPGLHGVEHPIYDIWLTGCKGGTEPVAVAPNVTVEPEPAPSASPKPPEKKPPKQRRPTPAEDLAAETPPLEPPLTEPGPIEVGPPPGAIPNVPPSAPRQRRAPSQRFYPTEPAPQRDPFNDGF